MGYLSMEDNSVRKDSPPTLKMVILSRKIASIQRLEWSGCQHEIIEAKNGSRGRHDGRLRLSVWALGPLSVRG